MLRVRVDPGVLHDLIVARRKSDAGDRLLGHCAMEAAMLVTRPTRFTRGRDLLLHPLGGRSRAHRLIRLPPAPLQRAIDELVLMAGMHADCTRVARARHERRARARRLPARVHRLHRLVHALLLNRHALTFADLAHARRRGHRVVLLRCIRLGVLQQHLLLRQHALAARAHARLAALALALLPISLLLLACGAPSAPASTSR